MICSRRFEYKRRENHEGKRELKINKRREVYLMLGLILLNSRMFEIFQGQPIPIHPKDEGNEAARRETAKINLTSNKGGDDPHQWQQLLFHQHGSSKIK